MSPVPACRCDELALLHDARADDHCDHLVRERVEEGGRSVWFRCPSTGLRWVLEFDDASERRSMRLRRLMGVGELVAAGLPAHGDPRFSHASRHPG